MKPRKIKRIIIYVASFTLLCALAMVWLFFLPLPFGIHYYRCKECDPNELIPILEWVYGANFPADIREPKIAKTSALDRDVILFVAKFSADPNSVESFLDSFPIKSDPSPYKCGWDKKDAGCLFTPRWFRKPIKQGQRHHLRTVREPVRNTGHIYTDTTDKASTIVYFEGAYQKSSEKPKQ